MNVGVLFFISGVRARANRSLALLDDPSKRPTSFSLSLGNAMYHFGGEGSARSALTNYKSTYNGGLRNRYKPGSIGGGGMRETKC